MIIKENNYKKAFSLCRTNKLDLNLIYDLEPNKFHENY